MIDNYISVEVKKKLKYFGFTIYYSNRLQKVILYHTKEDYQFCATKNDFIHIDDIAELIKILIRKKIKSGIYNVGSGNVVSVRYIYKIICDIFNKKTYIDSMSYQDYLNSKSV